MAIKNIIQLRRGTNTEWDAKSTEVLSSGEPGFLIDFDKLKIGDGITQWSDLTAINDAQTTIVHNATGSVISALSVVYINGGQGDKPTIIKSIASTEAGSSKTYGIVARDIPIGGDGLVVTKGLLKKINTLTPFGGITEGTTLYLSPTVAGGITTTKPHAPNHMVGVGKLIRVHQTQGVISVDIQNGFELDELHDVAVTGVTNNQYLIYNSGTQLWTPTSSGIFTKVAIGSNTLPETPISSLYVYGNIYSSGNGIFGTFDNNQYVQLGRFSGGDVGLVDYEDSPIAIKQADGLYKYGIITIDSNNNVGIGTTTPFSKLDVIGDGVMDSISLQSGLLNLGIPATQGFSATSVELRAYNYNNQAENSVLDISVPPVGNFNPVTVCRIYDKGVSIGNGPPLPKTETLAVYGNLELYPYVNSDNQIPGTDGANIITSGNAFLGGMTITNSDLEIVNKNINVSSGIITVNNSFGNNFNMIINSSGISIIDNRDIVVNYTNIDNSLPLQPLNGTRYNPDTFKSLFNNQILKIGDTILFKNFASEINNGVYIVTSGLDPGTIRFFRHPNYINGTVLQPGFLVGVLFNGSTYRLNTQSSVVVGTNNLIFDLDIGQPAVTFSSNKDAEFSSAVYAKEKYFRIKHPDPDSSYQHLQYGSLESPYHGVRLTGESELKKGVAKIPLPKYLKHLIHKKDINIQLTNKGHHKILYVDSVNLDKDYFVVKGYRSKTGGPFEFYWSFTGVRKDVDPLVPEQ